MFRILVLNLLLISSSHAAWNPLEQKTDEQTGAKLETMVAVEKFKAIPELAIFFEQADGYAVFPNVAKGGFGVGGAVGKGQVFQQGQLVGSTSLKQLSIGFQFGGQAFSEIIFFKSALDTRRFMEGNFEFGAQASAVLIRCFTIFMAVKRGLMAMMMIAGGQFLRLCRQQSREIRLRLTIRISNRQKRCR